MKNKNLNDATILIVDDNEANIEIIKGMLELSGYKNLVSTTDSRKVLDLVRSTKPDLLLLDLMMPYLSGFDIMDMLKSEEQILSNDYKYLPIIVITAEESQETKLKALTTGAKDYITNPFDIIEVKLRIRNILETQYLFQLLKEKNQTLEEKIINFLKLNNDWYR